MTSRRAALDRVLEHEAGDLTCIVEAGVRLSVLRDTLQGAGQRLSLDPPGDPSDRRVHRRAPLGAAVAPVRHAARPRAGRHRRPRRRHRRELGWEGREERRGVRPREAHVRLGGEAWRSSPAWRSGFTRSPRRPRHSSSRPTTRRPSSARCDARSSSRARSTSSTPGASPSCSRAASAPSRRSSKQPARWSTAPTSGDEIWSDARDRQARALGRVRFAPGDLEQRAHDARRGRRAAVGRHRIRAASRRRRPRHRGTARPACVEGAPRPRRGARMIEELTRACVHCGFCLPTCPTYVLWNEEMDSPRGRIQLMEKTAQGTLRLSPTVVEHFDRCLGCMACLSSCPSGVRYDRLIEETRHAVESEHRSARGTSVSSGDCCSRPSPTRDACASRSGSRRSHASCPRPVGEADARPRAALALARADAHPNGRS